MVVEWTPEAEKSLNRIFRFYQEKSNSAATAIITNIHKDVKLLASYPQIAAIEPVLADTSKVYRSLIVRRVFKVVYRIDEIAGQIIIITIWDCRQNPYNLKQILKG